MINDEQSLDPGKSALRDIKNTLKAGGADVAMEARGAAADLRGAASEAVEVAREAGGNVGRHARAAAGSAKLALGDAAETGRGAANDFIEYERANLQNWTLRAQAYMRNKPLPTFAAAAAVGVILGLWMRRPRR